MSHRPPVSSSLLVIAGLVVSLGAAACTAAAPAESTVDVSTASFDADADPFTLGPNDLVHVSVFGQAYQTDEPKRYMQAFLDRPR